MTTRTHYRRMATRHGEDTDLRVERISTRLAWAIVAAIVLLGYVGAILGTAAARAGL